MDSFTVSLSEDIFCVIRTVGERTTAACESLINEQLNGEAALVGNDVFRETLRDCFVKGLDSKKPLLLTCDADVLPYKGAINELVRLNSLVPRNYFQVVAEVDDFLLGGHRNGGLRLYRTDRLEKALQLLESSDSNRPESGLIRPMASDGHPSAYASSIIGIHDSHQYLADIYRKALFFSHKHETGLGSIVNHWRTQKDLSPEFSVALRGLCHGLLSENPGPDIRTNARALPFVVNEVSEFQERSEISEFELETIRQELRDVESSDVWVTYPSPKNLHKQLMEARRNQRSLTKFFSRKLARRLS